MNGKHQHSRTANSQMFVSENARSFPSLEAERAHDICCAIIEQAVYDWIALDYGRLGYTLTRNCNSVIYRAEVESFFKSEWFEHLLAYATPNIEPTTVRRRLKIAEPARRSQ